MSSMPPSWRPQSDWLAFSRREHGGARVVLGSDELDALFLAAEFGLDRFPERGIRAGYRVGVGDHGRREVPERTKILSEAFDDRSVLPHGEVREAQLVEPGEARFAALEHGDGRRAARDEANV